MESVTRDIIFRVKYETDTASMAQARAGGDAIAKAQNDFSSAIGRARAELAKTHKDLIGQFKEQENALKKVATAQQANSAATAAGAKRGLEGVEKLTQGAMGLARAWAVATAANEENAEKALRNLARFESGIQAIGGAKNLLEGGAQLSGMFGGGAAAAGGAAGVGGTAAGGAAAVAAPVAAAIAAIASVGAALLVFGEIVTGASERVGSATDTIASWEVNLAKSAADGEGIIGALLAPSKWALEGIKGREITGESIVSGGDQNKRLQAEREQIRRNAAADLFEAQQRVGAIGGQANIRLSTTRDTAEQREIANSAIAGAKKEQRGPDAANAYRLEADMLGKIIALEEDRVEKSGKSLQLERQKTSVLEKNLEVAQRATAQEKQKYQSQVDQLAALDPIQAGQVRQAAARAAGGGAIGFQDAKRLEGLGFEPQIQAAKEQQVKNLGLDSLLAPARQAAQQAQAAEQKIALDVKTQSDITVKLEGEDKTIVAAVTKEVERLFAEKRAAEVKALAESEMKARQLGR